MTKTGIILAAIVLIASFLRLINLANVPVGFQGDEVAVGYNAYSLLNTARDVNNAFLPLAIDQWGDKRPAGLHYLTIPSIAIFGLNEFATRLPASLFGIATVVLFYFFVKNIFGDKYLALLSAGLLSLSPWHILTSRATSESIVSLFFVLAGSWALWKVKSSAGANKKWLLVSLFCFGISFWFYHAARLFVPLFVGAVFLFALANRSVPTAKKVSLGFFCALLIAMVTLFLFTGGTNRPKNISIFGSPQTQLVVDEQLRESVGQPIVFARALHNKYYAYLTTFARNYLAHFTGAFLALEGGGPARYMVSWSGMMYLVDLPFFLIGFSWLLVSALWKKNNLHRIILLWLILAPFPAALTFEDIPNVQRAIMMLPALIIITSIGIQETLRLIIKKYRLVASVILIFIYVYSLVLFVDSYFTHSFTHQPWHRNAGEKELVLYIKDLLKQGKTVVATASADNNALFYLFFLKMPPKPFQQLAGDPLKANKLLPNLRFIVQDCPGLEEVEDTNTVIVGLGECQLLKTTTLVNVIRRPDNTVAFQIYTGVAEGRVLR